jgi:hypothetical protein
MKKEKHYLRKRIFIIIFSILVLLSIYFFRDDDFILRVVTSIVTLILFYTLDHIFNIKFKAKHYTFITIITIAGVMLSPLYFISPQYDKILHLFQPILICSILFHVINKLKITDKWKIWFTFFITLSILTLFEMGEYSLDRFFDFKLQGVYLRDISGLNKLDMLQEPIDDTMIDLFFGTLGCCIYGIFSSIKKGVS